MSSNESEHEFFELLKQAREGDRDALGTLLEKYRRYLLLIANQDADSWFVEKMAASDLVQTSLVNGYQHFCQFHGNSEVELRAWLKTILKNGVRKGQRHFKANKRNVNQEVKLEAQPSGTRSLFDRKMTPQTQALAREKARSVEQCMEQLTPEQRQVIRLRNFEQLSFVEIGQRMGRSEEATRKFWARSIESLKSAIKNQSPGLIDS